MKLMSMNQSVPFAFVMASLLQAAPAIADDKVSDGKKTVSVAVGYYDSREVSCNWGNHCRDDLSTVDAEFMKYLDDGKKAVTEAAASGASADEMQRQVDNYRAGLQARETLYGTCPGRCLSYDFPVDLRNSCKVVARSSRVDVLVDIPAIYYGASLVLKGSDQTSKVAEELKKQTARYR
jgi:UDP-N-acetyl-D-mannosaminuronate dehydrogenase